MSPERRADDVDDIIQSVPLDDGWYQTLLSIDRAELAVLLGDLANRATISSADIRQARIGLPSFFTAKWAALGPTLGLNKNINNLSLDKFKPPLYCLPPSFYKTVCEMAWRTQDVYQEKLVQTRDTTRLRMLDSVRSWAI